MQASVTVCAGTYICPKIKSNKAKIRHSNTVEKLQFFGKNRINKILLEGSIKQGS